MRDMRIEYVNQSKQGDSRFLPVGPRPINSLCIFDFHAIITANLGASPATCTISMLGETRLMSSTDRADGVHTSLFTRPSNIAFSKLILELGKTTHPPAQSVGIYWRRLIIKESDENSSTRSLCDRLKNSVHQLIKFRTLPCVIIAPCAKWFK